MAATAMSRKGEAWRIDERSGRALYGKGNEQNSDTERWKGKDGSDCDESQRRGQETRRKEGQAMA